MSDVTLRMLLLADDRTASKTLKGVGDEADKTAKRSQAMSKALTVGLGALAVGAAAIFKTGIDEQSDFLKGQAQLTAGVKSTGGAANASVDHMEDLASSIQNYSGQTDDSVVASEKLLLTFTNIQNKAGKTNDIFDQTVKISADMAARMGGDASSSAIQLGKALNDPVKGITALTRVGVSFTDGQKKQIAALVKSGNTLGAQKIILRELNKEFGGSAKAAGQTLPGQLARAKRSFEDVSQSLISALMPALVGLGHFLTSTLVPILSTVIGWLVNKLGPVFKTVGQIVMDAWQALTQGFQNGVDGFSVSADGWIAIFIIAGAWIKKIFEGAKTVVMTVVDFIRTHWTQIVQTFQFVWSTVKPILDATGQILLTLWHSVIEPLVGWIKAHWSEISTALKVVAVIIGVAFKALAVVITLALQAITLSIRLNAAVIKTLVAGITATIDGIKTAVSAVSTWVKARIDDIVKFFTGMGSRITKGVTGAFNAVGAAFQTLYNNSIGPILGAIEKIDDFFSTGGGGPAFGVAGVARHGATTPGSGAKGGTYGSQVPTFRAGGGPVTAGMPYIVGENRPELFVPSTSGRILSRVPGGSQTISVVVELGGQAIIRHLENVSNNGQPFNIKIRGVNA